MSVQTLQTTLQLESRPLPEPAASIKRIIETEALGRANAIPMPDLAARLGISTRTLQSEIEWLIVEHGCRIGSSCGKVHGYYWITDQADLELTYRNRMNRAIANFRAAWKLQRGRAAAEMLGQVSLVEKEN